MDHAEPRLIALDWGTSTLRAYLLGADGTVLDMFRSEKGASKLDGDGFAAAFEEATAAWRERWPKLPALASGMVGSNIGWVEAPYVSCPASVEDLAGALVRTPGNGPLIVPGVAQRGGMPNVMRGEETHILGVFCLHPHRRAKSRMTLLGTHSKWVEVEEGRITRFDTYMTGELYAVLRAHSILGRLAKAEPTEVRAHAAFERGVRAAGERGHAAPLLFSARSLVLTGQMHPDESLDYLSGLLIGDELQCAGATPDLLIGDPRLCERYQRAMSALGRAEVPFIDTARATPAGLFHIAEQAGLLA